MFVVIAKSNINNDLIYLIKAKAKRWRPIGQVGRPDFRGPQEFTTIERAKAEIRRATQTLQCKVITSIEFNKLWVSCRKKHEINADGHLARILRMKLNTDLEEWPVELDDTCDDATFGISDGGCLDYAT